MLTQFEQILLYLDNKEVIADIFYLTMPTLAWIDYLSKAFFLLLPFVFKLMCNKTRKVILLILMNRSLQNPIINHVTFKPYFIVIEAVVF